MGQMNVTNCVGSKVDITLEVNGVTLTESKQVNEGNTYEGSYNDHTSQNFNSMKLKVDGYSVALNRDHYFGDNNGAYPGSDYDINLILMGFDDANIKLMQVYRKKGDLKFNYCDDTKNLQP